MSTTFRRTRSGLYVPPALPPGYAGQQLGRGSLMGYWRQGEPTNSSVMADSGPGGHHGIYRFGTKTGAPSLLSGDADLATSAGTGDVGFGSWMNVAAITAECLIKMPGAGISNKGIFTRFGAGGSCWLLWINVSGQIAWRAYNTSGGSVDLSWSTAPSVNTEYLVAGTYQSGQARLYINGTQVAASTALSGPLQTSASQDIEIMAYNGGGFFFTGVGDEFAVHDTELSAGDLASDFALV